MQIRKAGKEDFIELHKLLLSIFPNAEAKISAKDEFFLAEEKDGIVGFAHYTDGSKIVLRGFGVREGVRNKGVGGLILDRLIFEARKGKKKIYLKTKMNNPALKLYYSKGFVLKREIGETLTLVFRTHT